MNTWTMRIANTDDVDDVVELLNEAAQRLHDRGIDQWAPGWMTPDRVRPMVQRGETWVGHDHEGDLAVTISLGAHPDPDFWSIQEKQEPALYLAKMASRQTGAGSWAMEWAIEYAKSMGYPRIRLDAWVTNEGLHRYYREQGWTHIRNMHIDGRNSGALFERMTSKREYCGNL